MTHQQQAQAFLEMAGQHREQLTAFARSLARDEDEAHDLFQDALLKCHDRILEHGFFGVSYIPYLVTAIKFNFYNTKRRGPVHLPLTTTLMAEEAEDCQPGSADDQLTDAAILAGIMTHVASHYEPEQASVFELRVNGLTFCEIGFSIGKTENAARHIFRKIRADLKKTFQL